LVHSSFTNGELATHHNKISSTGDGCGELISPGTFCSLSSFIYAKRRHNDHTGHTDVVSPRPYFPNGETCHLHSGRRDFTSDDVPSSVRLPISDFFASLPILHDSVPLFPPSRRRGRRDGRFTKHPRLSSRPRRSIVNGSFITAVHALAQDTSYVHIPKYPPMRCPVKHRQCDFSCRHTYSTKVPRYQVD
jgi:hypothetical protein